MIYRNLHCADLLILLFKQIVDPRYGIEKIAYGVVVVQSVDDICNILAHIDLLIPFARKKLGGTIDKVGREYLDEYLFLIRLCRRYRDRCRKVRNVSNRNIRARAFFLELQGYVEDGISRGNHVVNDDDILAADISSEILVRFDGVLAVDDNGIVAALIEHSEVYAEDGRIIHAARHCALVGSHDHDIVVSERDIGYVRTRAFSI